MIKSDTYQKYLQDPIVTIRGDRYVVPVKQEYGDRSQGLFMINRLVGQPSLLNPWLWWR